MPKNYAFFIQSQDSLAVEIAWMLILWLVEKGAIALFGIRSLI